MKSRNDSDQTTRFIKFFIQKILGIKYIYIAVLLLGLGIAYLYNRYSPKEYELITTIGPLKDTRTTALASNEMFRAGNYSPTTSGRDLETALNSLSSFELASKTVKDLNLEIGYFHNSKGLFRQTTEIYLQSPFIVTLDKTHNQILGTDFFIKILSSSSFRIYATTKNGYLYNYIENVILDEEHPVSYDTICKFNEPVKSKDFCFTISANPQIFSAESIGQEYYFELYHPDYLAIKFMKELNVEPVSYLASIINVKFSSTNLHKSLNFLNNYVNSFLEDNLAKKNKTALNTINFINSQISEMSDSLSKSESSLRNFRSSNQVMDLSYQGQQIYDQMARLETERTALELQSRYYNYILNYFKTNQDISGVTPPTSANITDPILNKLISDIISLNAEKLTITNATDKNLFSVQLENKIRAQKQAIIDNVTNSLNTLNLTLNELKYKEEKLSYDMSNLPKKELNMVNIQRDFDLNNSIYTYLLQKKAEAAIALSSNYPDYEVLEPAREVTSKIIKPKTLLNYLIAIFLALFFPTMYIFINDFLRNKVTNAYDIERISEKSLFGIIYANSKKYEAVVSENPGSAIAESFRNLRSSLFLKLKSKESKTVLITSSQPQDGKSFISFNLAASIASVGFKTLIIDCDLRRPALHLKFKNENQKGLSNYMIKKASVNEIIYETSVENLYFIPAGQILSNTSELIEFGVLDSLFEELKESFDYIIIDTPPLGLVADTIQLMKYASQILLVAKQNTTKKETLANAIDALELNKISEYELVLNGVNIEKSPYSSYKAYYLKE